MARGCGCFVPLTMTVFGVGFGIQTTLAWVANPSPTVLSCGVPAEGSTPTGGLSGAWVTLRDCTADPRVAVFAPRQRPRRAWVALRSSDDPDAAAEVVVEVRDDPELIAALAEVELTGALPGPLANSIATSSGLTEPADGLGMRARRMLGMRDVALRDDLVVVRRGERPSVLAAAAWWGLGVLGVAALAMTLLSVVFPTHEPGPGAREGVS